MPEIVGGGGAKTVPCGTRRQCSYVKNRSHLRVPAVFFDSGRNEHIGVYDL